MALLDESRVYGIAGEGECKFYTQDGKTFDIGTLKEICPAPVAPKKEAETPSVLVCKFCGAKRETPEMMKEHLLALHKDDMEKSRKVDVGKELKTTPEKPKGDEEVAKKPVPKRRGRPRKKK